MIFILAHIDIQWTGVTLGVVTITYMISTYWLRNVIIDIISLISGPLIETVGKRNLTRTAEYIELQTLCIKHTKLSKVFKPVDY